MTFDVGVYRTPADLQAVARAMDEKSAERYRELAGAFDVYCNQDTADTFRELAEVEERNVSALPPSAVAPQLQPWMEEDPAIADPGAVHYLMHPWHAFDLALTYEERALGFFETVAAGTSDSGVRAEATRLAERERGHVAAIKARRDEQPIPPDDWEDDPDPPNWDM